MLMELCRRSSLRYAAKNAARGVEKKRKKERKKKTWRDRERKKERERESMREAEREREREKKKRENEWKSKREKKQRGGGKKAANSFPGQRVPFTSSAVYSRAAENKNDLAKRLLPLPLRAGQASHESRFFTTRALHFSSVMENVPLAANPLISR